MIEARTSNRSVVAASLRATLFMWYHIMFSRNAERNIRAIEASPNINPFLRLSRATQSLFYGW